MAKAKKKDNNAKLLVKVNSYLILLNAVVAGFLTTSIAVAAFGVVTRQLDIDPTEAQWNLFYTTSYYFIGILLLTGIYTFINNKCAEKESKKTFILTIVSSITLVLFSVMTLLMYFDI